MADVREHTGGRRAIDDATRARVIELARGGMSRNAIVRELGVGWGSVSRICDAEGITFDRAATAAATAAHSLDAKAERARLAQRLLAEANAALDRLRVPHVVVGWHQGPHSSTSYNTPLRVT